MPPSTNVLLITVDSLRADAVTAAPESDLTPELGDLAARGTVFENAFSHGNWTPFSFPSLLASRPVFTDTDDIGLPAPASLPEVLRDTGVATAGFNAANGFLSSHWGYDRGFEEFETFLDRTDTDYERYLAAHPTIQAWCQLTTAPFRRALARLRHGDDGLPFADTSRSVALERRARAFIRRTDEPFFCWLHYMDTHTPYVPAPRYVREISARRLSVLPMLRAHVHAAFGWRVNDRTLAALRTLYAGAVRQVDASIGRLRECLREAGVAEDTCVIVAGDHGEEFMEHGHLAHYPKLYDELIHVPLLVDDPNGGPRRVSEHVGLDSIPPTVCEIMGETAPAEWEGSSLARIVRSGGSPDPEPIVSVTVRGESVTQQPIPRRPTEGDLLVSARTNEWTYIENTTTGAYELIRRGSGGERHDTTGCLASAEEQASAIERLRPVVARHAARLERQSNSRTETVPDAINTRLDALGYQ